MANMTTFFEQMLSIIAQFLISEPIIYIFGLVLLCFIVKVFKILTSSHI